MWKKDHFASGPLPRSMTLFEQATQADVNQDLRATVQLYEQCAQTDTLAIREAALLNLLLIYWDCTFDYGVYCGLLADGFTELELAHMYQRKNEIQQVLAAAPFPSYEARFWGSYIREEESYGKESAQAIVAQLQHECPEEPLAAYYVVDRAAPRVADPSSAGAPPWALAQLEQLQAGLARAPQTYKTRLILNHIASMLQFHRL